MNVRTLVMGAAAALALTTTSSFANPAHSVTQVGERHVDYAGAQWQSREDAGSVAIDNEADNDPNHACPMQCK